MHFCGNQEEGSRILEPVFGENGQLISCGALDGDKCSFVGCMGRKCPHWQVVTRVLAEEVVLPQHAWAALAR